MHHVVFSVNLEIGVGNILKHNSIVVEYSADTELRIGHMS